MLLSASVLSDMLSAPPFVGAAENLTVLSPFFTDNHLRPLISDSLSTCPRQTCVLPGCSEIFHYPHIKGAILTFSLCHLLPGIPTRQTGYQGSGDRIPHTMQPNSEPAPMSSRIGQNNVGIGSIHLLAVLSIIQIWEGAASWHMCPDCLSEQLGAGQFSCAAANWPLAPDDVTLAAFLEATVASFIIAYLHRSLPVCWGKQGQAQICLGWWRSALIVSLCTRAAYLPHCMHAGCHSWGEKKKHFLKQYYLISCSNFLYESHYEAQITWHPHQDNRLLTFRKYQVMLHDQLWPLEPLMSVLHWPTLQCQHQN